MRTRPSTFVSHISSSSSSLPSAIVAADREAGVVHEDVDPAVERLGGGGDEGAWALSPSVTSRSCAKCPSPASEPTSSSRVRAAWRRPRRAPASASLRAVEAPMPLDAADDGRAAYQVAHRRPPCRVDEILERAAVAPVREAHEVAEERRVRPLAASCAATRASLEQPVGPPAKGRARRRPPRPRRPAGPAPARATWHSRNLSRTAALHSAKREDRRPEGDRRRGTAGRTRARHGRAPGRRRRGCRGRAGAGVEAGFTDDAYRDAGAELGDAWAADLVLKVQRPDRRRGREARVGQMVVGLLQPLS